MNPLEFPSLSASLCYNNRVRSPNLLGKGMNRMMRFLLCAALTLAALAAHAQFTFSVTAPADGTFIGLTTDVKFLITNANEEVTVRVTADGPTGQIVNEEIFTPDRDDEILDKIVLNFNESTPEGEYVLTIEAFDSLHTATPVTRTVTLDARKPRILDSNPVSGGAVKGPVVPITVRVEEANLKQWKVTIDDTDIPNNTGTTLDGNNSFQVDWNVENSSAEGNHTIAIEIVDKGNNKATRNISVRVDRTAPSISIAFPRSDSQIRANSDFSVIVDIFDSNNGLVDVTGMDIIIRKMDGTYLYRVPRIKFTPTGQGAYRWTGRVRKRSISLPSEFKIVAAGVDRAGNLAVVQEVVINTNRGRGRNSRGRR